MVFEDLKITITLINYSSNIYNYGRFVPLIINFSNERFAKKMSETKTSISTATSSANEFIFNREGTKPQKMRGAAYPDKRPQILVAPILASLRNLHCDRTQIRFFESVRNHKLAQYRISDPAKMIFSQPLKIVEESYAALLDCKSSTEDNYSDSIWSSDAVSRIIPNLSKYGRGSLGGKVYKLSHDCKFFLEHSSTAKKITAEEFKQLIARPKDLHSRLVKYLNSDPKEVKEEEEEVESEFTLYHPLILHIEFSCRVINDNDDKFLRTPLVFITSLTVCSLK